MIVGDIFQMKIFVNNGKKRFLSRNDQEKILFEFWRCSHRFYLNIIERPMCYIEEEENDLCRGPRVGQMLLFQG